MQRIPSFHIERDGWFVNPRTKAMSSGVFLITDTETKA